MEYQVLARKWRPGTFSDLVGQEHITRTLQNALLGNRIAHAYLFVGPRGIGKTTIARILAKAINCKNAPVAEPCDKCSSCVSINDGNNIDIIEIDGASNNSVDNIRRLREEVLYSPINSKYKVYIIDEVHMLTNSAWNALLKTLEEPPAHVKFIFATTEVHEVLPTVISRCQRFDLRKIPQSLIVERLGKIAESENVQISKNATRVIARAADGGMRDALSLMDQLIAFNGDSENNNISEEQVLTTFGITSQQQRENLLKAILTNDYGNFVLELNAVAQQGKTIEHLFYDIIEYLRGIEITLLVDDPDAILEVGEDSIEVYRKLSSFVSLEKLQLLLESLSAIGRMLHDSINKHVFIETAIMKAMRYSSSVKVNDIIRKLNELKGLGSASGDSQLSVQKVVPYHEKINEQRHPAPVIVPTKVEAELKKSEPPVNVKHETSLKVEDNVATLSPTISSTIAPEKEEAQTVPEKPRKVVSPEKLWHALIVEMDTEHINKPQLKFWMQEAKPLSVKNDVFTICFDEEFNALHSRRVIDEKALLEKCMHRLTGINNLTLNIMLVKGLVSPPAVQKTKDLDEVKEKILNNEFVKKTLDIFDGTLVDFRG